MANWGFFENNFLLEISSSVLLKMLTNSPLSLTVKCGWSKIMLCYFFSTSNRNCIFFRSSKHNSPSTYLCVWSPCVFFFANKRKDIWRSSEVQLCPFTTFNSLQKCNKLHAHIYTLYTFLLWLIKYIAYSSEILTRVQYKGEKKK